MAEVIAVGASIIAIYQITERIVIICKSYIETVHDAQPDLRKIFVEISGLKTIFKDLEFLSRSDSELSAVLTSMAGRDGPIGACGQAVRDLEKVLSYEIDKSNQAPTKRRKITLAALAWPLKASKAMKLLQDISMHKGTITLALTANSMHDIKDIKKHTTEIRHILTDSQRHEVFKWLENTDPSPRHHQARRDYEPGTGDWILRSTEWSNWVGGKNRCLWIHGIPGAGKTMLASYLIERIQKLCKAVPEKRCTNIYYYCYFGHNQDEAKPFLNWVINQLCRASNVVPTRLEEVFNHGGTPSLVDLMDVLESILSASFDKVYITIDAIDESKPRADLLKVLLDLATDARFQNVQLLATSREYLDIEKIMQEVSVEISMSNDLVDADIRTYVHSQLHSRPKFNLWPPHLLVEAEDTIMSKSKGMFRWAVCQIDILQRLEPRIDAIVKALNNLPKDLDETYERIFLAIPDENKIFVHHVLKWIHYYGQERRVYESNFPCPTLLQAVRRSTSHLSSSQQDVRYDEEVLRELCGCLIVTSNKKLFTKPDLMTTTVTFAHYTVLEFLQSTRICDSSVAFFGIDEGKTAVELTRLTILEALDVDSNTLGRQENHVEGDSLCHVIAQDFNSYCIISSLLTINSWTTYLNDQDDLVNLVFRLINPAMSHFKGFCSSVEAMDVNSKGLFERDFPLSRRLWSFKWEKLPADNNSAILLGLGGLRSPELLISKLLPKINMEVLSQDEIVLTIDDHRIRGSVIDAIAQIMGNEDALETPFLSLLESGATHSTVTNIMFQYIASHSYMMDMNM